MKRDRHPSDTILTIEAVVLALLMIVSAVSGIVSLIE
tara:strand:- start:3724 stop:3834 length:111 start_codon:yes stop_codon:yes gene_type:complete